MMREILGSGHEMIPAMGTVLDVALVLFGSGQRRAAAEGRLVHDMHHRASSAVAEARGEVAPPLEPASVLRSGMTSAELRRLRQRLNAHLRCMERLLDEDTDEHGVVVPFHRDHQDDDGHDRL